MAKPKVLISGAGIAGTVLAYWLGKYGFNVTVLERSPDSGTAGQIVDVEGPAQEIVKRMGILDAIKDQVTHEEGISLVDASNTTAGTIPVGSSSASNEIEIMRPALAEILFNAANSHSTVEFRFDRMIQSLTQDERKVTVGIGASDSVTFENEDFDVVVACDGLRSRTRTMILPPEDCKSCIRSVNVFCAFFSIPAEPQDRPYARICHFPGRRSVFMKPQSEKLTSVYFNHCYFAQPLHEARESRDPEKQKAAVKEQFSGLGWEVKRCLEKMIDTDNFYFEEISQVHLKKWAAGRCVLVGDTAYCPSPLTGQGTNLAILGAYVLASKMITNPDDPQKAFAAYEKDFRPYVDVVQPIPLGGMMPYLLNPDTTWGIWLLRTIIGWVSWLQVWRILPDVSFKPFSLPEL